MISQQNHLTLQSEAIFQPIRSIKNIQENESLLFHPIYELPLRFKGLILLSLFQKHNLNIKKIFYRWYIRGQPKIKQKIIDTFLSRKLSQEAFLYRLKIYIKNRKIRKYKLSIQEPNDCINVQIKDKIMNNLNDQNSGRRQIENQRNQNIYETLKRIISTKVLQNASLDPVQEKPISSQKDTQLLKKISLISMICCIKTKINQNIAGIFSQLKLQNINKNQPCYQEQIIYLKRSIELINQNFRKDDEIMELTQQLQERKEQIEGLEEIISRKLSDSSNGNIETILQQIKSRLKRQAFQVLLNYSQYQQQKSNKSISMINFSQKQNIAQPNLGSILSIGQDGSLKEIYTSRKSLNYQCMSSLSNIIQNSLYQNGINE